MHDHHFTNNSTQILASFFDGVDNLFALHDSLLENGQDEIATLVRPAIQGNNKRIDNRKYLIEFNRIFRKYWLSFRRIFKPDHWRVDDNTVQTASYLAEIKEDGTIKTRNGKIEWPYHSIIYALHKGGNWKSWATYRSWGGQEIDELVNKMRENGVAYVGTRDQEGPTEEQIWKSLNSWGYNRKISAGEVPEGMLWRGLLTMLAPYGSRDILRLMGTTRGF